MKRTFEETELFEVIVLTKESQSVTEVSREYSSKAEELVALSVKPSPLEKDCPSPNASVSSNTANDDWISIINEHRFQLSCLPGKQLSKAQPQHFPFTFDSLTRTALLSRSIMDYYELADEESEVELSQELNEDRDVLKKGRQALGLTRKYVPTWTARDAFREFFQNWMDGIVQSQKVSPRTITLTIKDTDKEWIATAHNNGSEEALGFIRFTKAKGMLELTNFKAQLTRKALDLGASSKRDGDNLAGTHGEGFKVASLVMVRKGFQVRYESAKYYWSFQFGGRDKSHLYCHLTPMNDNKLTKAMLIDAKRIAGGKPRELKSNIWEDVSVKIGKVYNSNGKQIDFGTFQEWIKISFALDRPANTITTLYGDLVLGVEFSNRVYLKGLYLGDSITPKKLKFGYNLLCGEVNRDRERLCSSDEEASAFAKIWAAAIDREEKGVLQQYVKMLLEDDEKNWGDVNLAHEKLTPSITKKVWDYLGTQDPQRSSFFYHTKTHEQDVTSIERHLKKHAKPLPSCIWEPFRKCNLVRTPQEQRHFLLANAPISDLQEDSYSNGFKRILSAALGLDERTSHLNLVFKSGAAADLDLLLDGDNLIINDKWLDFKTSHRKAPCWLSRIGIKVEDFSCDHIIYKLYGLVLAEFKKSPQLPANQAAEGYDSLRLEVAESLRQMPRTIVVLEGNRGGELSVFWTVVEEDWMWQLYEIELKCRVTLHRERTCSEKRADVLSLCGAHLCSFSSSMPATRKNHWRQIDDARDLTVSNASSSDPEGEVGTAVCGCPYKVTSQKDGGCVFQKLDIAERYFPMVARDYNRAFFGVPPLSVQPAKSLIKKRDGSQDSDASLGSAGHEPETFQRPRSESTPNNSVLEDDNDSEEAGSPAIPSLSDMRSTGTGQSQTPIDDTNTQSLASPRFEGPSNIAAGLHTKAIGTIVLNHQSQDRRPHLPSQRLDDMEERLNSARQQLEIKDLELRQAKSDIDTQKQKLTSIIEDLRGEVEQMQENYSESEKQLTEATSDLESMRAKNQQLIAERSEFEVLANDLVAEGPQAVGGCVSIENAQAREHSDAVQEVNELPESVTNKISELEANIQSLQDAVNHAQEDKVSMTATLQGVSSMIQGVLTMPTRTLMVGTLQGVLSMMQGILTMGAHQHPTNTSGKRDRIKEEIEDDTPLAKRPRQGEVISLD
ncbi:hypothetical protein BDZ45DRAFT_806466 [Acephala macrosclerotiorum]|nr:hypothetical protein BDZ45DRAFT_806466 [Acephala macrosclerotiorum]